MFIEEGNVFLLAARKIGKDWVLSAQPGAPDCAVLARLCAHKSGVFTCVRQTAFAANRSSVTGVPETMHVEHKSEQISEDLPQLNAMVVALPGTATSGTVGSGPDCERVLTSQLERSSGELAVQLRMANESPNLKKCSGLNVLRTKQPKWNSHSDSYELPFHGRANWASERNFQLTVPSGRPDGATMVLLHGKLDEDVYALDFAFPLSPLHAFTICLSTCSW